MSAIVVLAADQFFDWTKDFRTASLSLAGIFTGIVATIAGVFPEYLRGSKTARFAAILTITSTTALGIPT
ncbi:MAG: hypothetical protein IPK27_17260 [Rhodanobacteraceae bacterium]|nr:hypothetical protein [Rhodanobacteraceae bacterium]